MKNEKTQAPRAETKPKRKTKSRWFAPTAPLARSHRLLVGVECLTERALHRRTCRCRKPASASGTTVMQPDARARLLSAALEGSGVHSCMAFEEQVDLLAVAEAHGVLPLLAAATGPASWLASAMLINASRSAQAVELARQVELRSVLEALAGGGVRALVVKGAALAYTHYAAPHLRPRVDTDLLIAPADKATASALLQELGFTRAVMVDRDAIFTQAMFSKAGIGHVRHVIDLHWQISNRPVFRDTLPFNELWARAVPVPQLGPSANAPAPVHALLLACIHVVAHHPDDWRLIWLYDVALIARRLTTNEWDQMWTLAAARDVSTLVARVLVASSEHFSADNWLVRSGAVERTEFAGRAERSSDYIDPQPRTAGATCC